MYSKELMKFLYNYQKDDFKPKEAEVHEIHFNNKGTGKPAEVLVTLKNK
ncbi:hypothetical protein IJ579_08980 [bacterium]|nr:hypothetical protein [bacterium]